MRLVLGAESLYGPLTGIGQYTRALALELRDHEDVEALYCFALGRLLPAAALLDTLQREAKENDSAGENTAENKASGGGASRELAREWLGRARSVAARNRLAVAIYERLMPRMERHALRGFGPGDVFHSPNYLLPQFPGRRVVSILDLSTVRFPEFHPATRVALVNRHIERAVGEAEHIITISELVREEIIARYRLSAERISVTWLAAEARFRPLSAQAWAEALQQTAPALAQTGADGASASWRGYFLFTGTIEPRKNLERMLDAYVAYRAELGTGALPLLITGTPGWKSEALHARLRQMAAAGSVHYLGYVPQEALPVLMAGARALLFASLYEGFGLPALEAMQCGTPVLSSRGSAMDEFGGEALLTVDPLDVAALAEKMVCLHRDDALCRGLSAAGIARARQFSWASTAQQTLAAYTASLS